MTTTEQKPPANNNRPEHHPTKASMKLTLLIWAACKKQPHSKQQPLFVGPKGARRFDCIFVRIHHV